MGMPAQLTQNGTGTTAVWTPDWMQNPFNISIGTICNSTASYQIQATLDNLDVQGAVVGTTAANATWYPIATTTLFQASTTMNVQFPVTGLRISVVTAGAVGSSVVANIIQATFGR